MKLNFCFVLIETGILGGKGDTDFLISMSFYNERLNLHIHFCEIGNCPAHNLLR